MDAGEIVVDLKGVDEVVEALQVFRALRSASERVFMSAVPIEVAAAGCMAVHPDALDELRKALYETDKVLTQ